MEWASFSMLGVKRLSVSCFPDRPHIKISKDDTFSIYESTMQKLQSGSSITIGNRVNNLIDSPSAIDIETSTGRQVSNMISESSMLSLASSNKSDLDTSWGIPDSKGTEKGRCFSCSKDCQVSCHICRRKICSQCLQCCEQCQEAFCSSCLIFNFDEHEDHVRCLDCALQ